MGITHTQRGFALLVAVIFMSVMLSLGLTLASLGYKQVVLASTATQSQYAFYAADAAMECLLYADQRQDAYNYAAHDGTNPPNATVCNNTPAQQLSYCYNTGSCTGKLVFVQRFTLDSGRCADVTVYKPSSGTTYLYAQGYDVSCSTVHTAELNPSDPSRFVARGIYAKY